MIAAAAIAAVMGWRQFANEWMARCASGNKRSALAGGNAPALLRDRPSPSRGRWSEGATENKRMGGVFRPELALALLPC